MYEETDKKFLTKDLVILILKLLFLAIFIFIICWLFLKTNKGNKITEVDSNYTTNINTMKTTAFEYFTKEKLPAKIGQSVKVTLEDMVNQKLLIDFTNNGKTCNLKESYIQATKTADENYALKVNLNCNNQNDYIVTTIEKKDIVCQTCNNQNTNNNVSNNNVSVNENKKEETNNSTTTNNTATNKKPTNVTTNKKPAQVTTKVITKVTYNYTYYNLCSSCNNSKKEKYYEVVKYGNWQNGENYNSGYETKCSNAKTYKYCQEKKVYYYANCTVPASSTEKIHSFMLQIPYYEEDKPYHISSTPYTSLSDYQTYINSKKVAPASNDDKFYQTFPEMDPSTMMASSLKGNNFRINSVGSQYYQGNLVLRYSLLINNKDGVKPYYATRLGYNVNFIPVKITIGYDIKNTCVTDTLENANKYPNYHRTYLGENKVCQNRQVTKKWVSEKDLNNYLNQGWSKTGNTKIK